MSKRFTDTELWTKPWFMELTPAEKLAWFYIKDNCDNVGVWTPNFRLGEFILGMQLDWEKFRLKCHDNIVVMENSKWWLIDFCRFQHPDLSPMSNSKPIKSYIKTLKQHGLWDDRGGCPKGNVALTEPYKEQEREKVKVREEEKEEDEFSDVKKRLKIGGRL